MIEKLLELTKNFRLILCSSQVSLRFKIAYFVTLPLSPVTKSVSWFGRTFRTDNRLGCFLLPGYIQEIENLLKIMDASSRVLMLDIGANVGQFACTAAALTNWNIHSFEPNEAIYGLLARNTRGTQIRVNNFGIGASTEQLDLYFVEGKSAQGSISRKYATKKLRGKLKMVTINLITLEHYLLAIQVDKTTVLAMKIDVEGMELQVIERIGSLKFEVVQLEFTPNLNHSLEDFLQQAKVKLRMENAVTFDFESGKRGNSRNVILRN